MKTLLILFTLSSFVVLVGCQATQVPGDDTTAADTDNTNNPIVEETNENENANDEVMESNENATPTEEIRELDTSDWETYENEEYGFSFRYPGEWSSGTNKNDIGCVSNATIVCDTYSYGNGSFEDFPTEYVYGKIGIEQSESLSTLSEKEILIIEPGKETMPLIEEKFLTINQLSAYRSLRQLKKGELLRPTAQDFTERTEKTVTEIEYRYVYNSILIRLTFSIQSESYEKYYETIDVIGQSFSI